MNTNNWKTMRSQSRRVTLIEKGKVAGLNQEEFLELWSLVEKTLDAYNNTIKSMQEEMVLVEENWKIENDPTKDTGEEHAKVMVAHEVLGNEIAAAAMRTAGEP